MPDSRYPPIPGARCPVPGARSAMNRSEFRPRSRAEWRTWLAAHHASCAGVWVVYAKKHTGLPTVSYNDAVEEALCVGWIDGVVNPVDDRFYRQLFTPRKPRSHWAASNKTRVARLARQGLMTEAGRGAIRVAKKNGSWHALDAVEALLVPPELEQALSRNPAAKAHWRAMSDGRRKQFLFWLNAAKRAATRQARIAMIVHCAANKIPPAKRPRML